MRVMLLRHGLTALGEAGRYQGRLDEGLSEHGRAELQKADFCPRKVYVSPQLRSRETAAILFPSAEQVIVPDLREMDFGDFEGRSWREMEEDRDYRLWVEGGCTGCCPGGEDRAGFSERVCAAFDGIMRQAQDEEIVIVAHGGTQMAVLERWGDPPRDYYQWQSGCGCGWLLEAEGGRLRVLQEVDFRK